ncbi:MAG: peptidoglycan-binding protein [Acidimicrobiales bacterium]|nr:peptidoglycan-binding protein [Acidimicrobiales bacterium]
MDEASRRTIPRDLDAYGVADDTATDLDAGVAERRPRTRRGLHVNMALLVVAVIATIAGIAYLVIDGSGGSTTPTVDAADTATGGSAAATADPLPSTTDTTPAVPPTERPALGVGSAGPDVVTLQERLVALGFDPGSVDGNFGPGTATAVQAFQTSAGLTADGVVGAETWAALDPSEPATPSS